MEDKLTTSEMSKLRETALKMARDINPNTSLQNMAYASSNTVPPSLDKVIKDAQTIFEWLIKPIKQ